MNRKIIGMLIGVLGTTLLGYGQDDKVKFGAVSRGMLQESTLDKSDTLNPNRNNTGDVMVDLRLNINPNRKTEIGTVVRMQSDMGGLYGAGSMIQLRQLFLKGTMYDVVNYELGDIYLQLSPYTLFNSEADGQINESGVFSNLRNDLSYYDNFNIGNTWWSQGGHLNFGFEFDTTGHKGMQFDVFTSRVQSNPTTRFMTGGKAGVFQKQKYLVNANFIQLFDLAAVTPAMEQLNNRVASLEGSYTMPLAENNLVISGETGMSLYRIGAPINAPENYLLPEDKTGQFMTVKAEFQTKEKRFKGGIRYLNNSAEFYSAGAQSKRINFLQNPQVFQNVANNPFQNRNIHLFDLIAETNLYNPRISGELMTYDPKYGNALPFGMATPNRTGAILNSAYTDSLNIVKLTGEFGLLSDVSGVGTTDKRNFTHAKATADFALDKLIGFKRDIVISGGVLYNKTTRDGDLAAIDLQSTMIDLGLDVEIATRFYLELGLKQLNAKGNEFIYDLSDRNTYKIPTFYSIDGSASVLAAGARYKFTDNMYLSITHYAVDDKNALDPTQNYSFNQWMMLFSLKL